jgi:carbon storage regulator
MLVLSRKKNESICIGGGITITVAELRGNTVKLTIDAPLHVPVHRQEVFERIQRERAGDHAVETPPAETNEGVGDFVVAT